MSGITSSVGLLSGLPTQDIIDAYINASSGPIRLLEGRIQQLQIQRTAFMDLAIESKKPIERIEEEIGNVVHLQIIRYRPIRVTAK